MQEIKALELLGITKENSKDYSIRLNNVMSHFDPWTARGDDFYKHLFGSKWPGSKRGRRIQGERVLQFLQLSAWSPLFVFIGCYETGDLVIEQTSAGTLEYYDWHNKEVERFTPFARRLVVRFKRKSGFLYNRMDFNMENETFANDFLNKMTVEYIRSSPYEIMPFPGYANVSLTHSELSQAVKDEEWKVALSNVQAVYLQTDLSNGWHYVGSAYSQGGEHAGLLSRWTNYAEGDHTGGNALLRAIPNAKEHIERYFQYSILEVFDMKTDADTIIQREHWWMKTLDSVRDDKKPHPHGYNSI